jgi:trk system potassium uptake protein TrkA
VLFFGVSPLRNIPPEKEIAHKVAKSLISPNILDYIPLSEDYTICEMAPPSCFMGKRIGELMNL